MGLRFTKRIKIMPGLSLNLGKKNIKNATEKNLLKL